MTVKFENSSIHEMLCVCKKLSTEKDIIDVKLTRKGYSYIEKIEQVHKCDKINISNIEKDIAEILTEPFACTLKVVIGKDKEGRDCVADFQADDITVEIKVQ